MYGLKQGLIYAVVLGVFFLSVGFSFSQLSDPENISFSVSTDKEIYFLDEIVRVSVSAPGNSSTNLSILDPQGGIYSTFKENLGNFTHLYSPSSIGDYSVHAHFSLLNISSNASAFFKVIPFVETNPLENASLWTDKPTYYLNEIIRISVSAPKNTTTNLTIRNPTGSLYSTLKELIGSFTHLFFPEFSGNHSVRAFFSLQNWSSNSSVSFSVLSPAIENATNESEVPENPPVSPLDLASLSTDKVVYQLDETVRISLSAPENTSTNLTIQNPLGGLYSSLKEKLGSFTHLYLPEFIGDYLVFAELSLHNETRDLNTSFQVVAENVSKTNISESLFNLKAMKKYFNANKNPEFILYSKKKPEKEKIKAIVYYGGQETDIQAEVEEMQDGNISIKILKKRAFRAGLYTLQVQVDEDHTIEREFSWGLVSLNTRKSIYAPGEMAEFIIVVLDSEGHSVCNAELYLSVTDPENKETMYSTSDGTISPSQECGIYYANYSTEIEGNHTVEITALVSGMEVNFSTHFLVREEYGFDIIRTAESKIDPTQQEWFDVSVGIESFIGGDALTVEESVPAEFEVLTDADIQEEGDTKILTWNKELIDGKTTVTYSYSVPEIWPYLYTLGPLEINSNFSEARPWYIAVDPSYPATPTASNDNEVTETGNTFVTKKTLTVTKNGESWLKTEHELATSNAARATELKIVSQSNGAITCTNSSTTVYPSYTTYYCELDISSLSDGSQSFNLQLRRTSASAATAYNRNWRIYLEVIPSIVTLKTHGNSSYSGIDKFFSRQQTIFVEANVTASDGSNMTDATVTANFTVGGSFEKILTLSHYSGSIYRGNWTTNSTQTVGVYNISVYANNSDGNTTGSNSFHLYSGENVSAYRMDWNDDGSNESVMENRHLIAVFNETDNTDGLILYLEQKDSNVGYTFGKIYDPNSIGRGEVTTTNMKEIRIYDFSFSQEGENLASVDLNIKTTVNDPPPSNPDKVTEKEISRAESTGVDGGDRGLASEPFSGINSGPVFGERTSSIGSEQMSPTISSIYVEPLKVAPGDFMHVSAEVSDGYEIESVTAYMGGIEIIELRLLNGSVYRGIWGGDWLVHDTENREYTTTVTATNALGFSSSADVGWSDPPNVVQIHYRWRNDDNGTSENDYLYVNATTGNDSTAELNNPDKPWKTINESINYVKNNLSPLQKPTIIEIQDSATYTEGIRLAGITTSSTNRLTIRGAKDQMPTWKNDNSNILFCDYDSTNSYGALDIAVSYVTIERISFTGTKNHGVKLCWNNVHNITIRNCIFHDMTISTGNYNHNSVGVYGVAPDSQVYNNVFYNLVYSINFWGNGPVKLRNNIFSVNPCSSEVEMAFVNYNAYSNNHPDSNYNIFQLNTGYLAVGSWNTPTYYTTLADWQACSITPAPDQNSTSGDPKYVTAGTDFHLKSVYGHWTSSGWVNDSESSSGIDAGVPFNIGFEYTYYDKEAEDNGDRVNIGAYGNTDQASLSGNYTGYWNEYKEDGTWKAAEDTLVHNQSKNEGIRLRFSIRNTGTSADNYTYRLQVAARGDFYSCENVTSGYFSDVPTTSDGCGSAVACITNATWFEDGAPTISQLSTPSSLTFVRGGMVEDSSNQTDKITLNQDTFTEIEYNFQFTDNASNATTYCFRVVNGGVGALDGYSKVATITTTELTTSFNLTVTMRTEDVDYLVYRLHNFDSSIDDISDVWSDIAGTLGSSVSDDRYHLENGTDALVSSLTAEQWNDYTASNYSLIYDNSATGDSVNDNVIAWIRFNETENISFQDTGLWNSSSEGLRIRYNTSSASATDEVNYILAFTTGGYDTIQQWMSTVEGGSFPTVNFMASPPGVYLNSPQNQAVTNDTTPDFSFNVVGSESTYNCTLYLNDTNKGNNASTQNNTPTTITSTALSDGTYSWYVNCTATGFAEQSKIREITIDTTAPTTTATAIISNGSSYTFDTWTNSSYVNITLNCSDSGSGCDTTMYCTDTTNTCEPYKNFKQEINISTTAGNLTDYQVKINLNSSNVGAGFNWTRDENATRFKYYNTSSGKETGCSHWIESWNSSSEEATIWVKVPFLENNTNTTIYMNYGNPDAIYNNTQGGNDIFLFFDDFEGDILDTNKWSEIGSGGSYSVSDSILTVTGGASGWETIIGKTRYAMPKEFGYRAKMTETTVTNIVIDDRDAQGNFQGLGYDWAKWSYWDEKNYSCGHDGSETGDARTSDLSNFTLLKLVWTSTAVKFYEDGVLKKTLTTNVPQDTCAPLFEGYFNSSKVYIDWVFVREYTSIEPTIYFGSEESPSNIQITKEGISYIRYRSNDTLGNLEDTKNQTIKIDYTPAQITIVNPENDTNLSSETTWTWINVSTDENAVCKYNLTNSNFDYASQGTTFTNTSGMAHSFNYSGLADGQTYTLYYKCNDSTAGNINPSSVMHTFGVNKTVTFHIDLNSPDNETATDDSTPDFNFTVSGSKSLYVCELFINDSSYGKTDFINVGHIDDGGWVESVWGDGTYIYSADYAGLRAYTFNGTDFNKTGYIDDEENELGVWGDGTYIFLANQDGGLRAYTFNGTNFTNVGHIDDGGNGVGVWGDETYIYLANSGDGLRAYTFNGTNFTNVGWIDDGGNGVDVWGDGTYIYLANYADGLRAYTFNGTNFSNVGHIDDGDEGYGIGVWGDGTYIYLGNYGDGLRAYTFNGSNFTNVGHIYDGGFGQGVWGDGTYIYLANEFDGLRAYTFNGTNFSNVGHIDDGGVGWGVWGDGTYIYLANHDDGLRAYSFTPSALNNTPTTITANLNLSDGVYNWYINCTANGATNQSEIGEITIDATPSTTNASAVKNDSTTYTFDTWTNSSYVNITLSCDDGLGIGCDTTQYCTDTTNTCTPSWFNSSWLYRQPIYISNTAGNLTDYQVKIELTSANAGSHWNWTNNGSDIRFTYYNITGGTETECLHWIESWNSTSETATIWVKIPFIENNTDTIVNMYYGNTGAAYNNTQGGNNTFLLFDDFDSLTGWSGDTANFDTSNGYLLATNNTDSFHKIYKPFTENVAIWEIKARINGTDSADQIWRLYPFYNNTLSYWDVNLAEPGGGNVIALEKNGGATGSSPGIQDTYWHDIKVTRSSSADWRVYVDGTGVISTTDDMWPTATYIGIEYKQLTSNDYIAWDTLRVRKYASPEPSVSIGGEGSSTTIQVTTEGTSYIRYHSNDSLGNLEDTKNQTIKIDTTAPTINFVSPTSSGNLSQNWIAANVTALDGGVGLDTIKLTLWNSTGGIVQSNTSQTSPLFVNLTSLLEGTYYLNATANDTFEHTSTTETNTITLDTTKPTIILQSPENITYNTTLINLNVSADDIIDTWWYSLNSGTNITFTPNTTIIAEYGSNHLIVYANDTAGNENSSEIYFSTSNYLDDCSILNEPGTTYYLQKDIINSTKTTCINITANNIILEGQGHTVDGINTTSTYGIYILRPSQQTTNITVKNLEITDWYNGVANYYANNNTFYNITSELNYYGVYFGYTNYTNLTESTISNSLIGLWMLYSSFNTVYNSTFTSCSYEGVRIGADSTYNIFSNMTVSNGLNRGIFIEYAQNNTIKDSRIENNAGSGIYVYWAGFSPTENNKIYNNLFNNTNNSIINMFTAYINNWNTTNQTGTRIYSSGTNIGGNYWTNATGTGYSDTCNDTNEDGFCDDPYTLAANNTDYLPLSNKYKADWVEVTTCRNLNESGKTYQLSQNVSSPGTCFTIQADNITLNCLGYTINYSQSSVGYAVNNTGYNYTKIKNCNIVQGNTSQSNSYGIRFNKTINGSIENNTIQTSGSSSCYGIYILNSNNTRFYKNNITTTGYYGYGIRIDSSTNANFTDNIISTSDFYARGIYLLNSSDNTIYNNTISTASNAWAFAVGMYASSKNTLKENKFTTTHAQSIGVLVPAEYNISESYFNHSIDSSNLAHGKPILYVFKNDSVTLENLNNTYGLIYVTSSRNATIRNITVAGLDGIYLANTSDSTIANCTLKNTTSKGIGVYYSSSNNRIENNTISTNSPEGYPIEVGRASNNIIQNNILTTYASWDIGLNLWGPGSNNNITNNKITTHAGWRAEGVYIALNANNNTFYNITVQTSTCSYCYGIDFDSVSGNRFINSNINAGTSYDIYIRGTEDYINYIINGTFNQSDIGFENSSTTNKIEVQWYLDVYVNDTLSNPIDQSDVTGWMDNSSQAFFNQTNATGYITRQTLTEYLQNASQVYPTNVTYYTNYTINATKAGYTEETKQVNLTASKSIYLTLSRENNPPNKPTLNSPDNASYVNMNFVLLNWTCTDPDGDNMTAYIYGDNSTATTLINTTTGCVNGSSYTFNRTGLGDDIYYWKITCNDSSLANTSDTYEFMTGCNPPKSGNWNINSTLNCQDITRISEVDLVIGNNGGVTFNNVNLTLQKVTVQAGGVLRFQNSKNSVTHNNNWTISGTTYVNHTTHHINTTTNGAIGITVTSAGAFYIYNNSNITNGEGVGGNSTAHFFFQIDPGATFQMNDSVLEECGFAGEENQKGLFIQTDNVWIGNNTITNNYIGIYLNASDNNTIKDNTIKQNQYGILLYSSANNTIYNNLLNNTNNFYFAGTNYTNYWNTTNQTGTRVYSSGTNIGGNYWTNATGTGYSDTCNDTSYDGFCDDPYILATSNRDYLPLSNKYTATAFHIDLNSPPNQTTTNDNTPDFNFNVTGITITYTCELFINGTGYENRWFLDSSIVSGLGDVGGRSKPEVYQKDGVWHLISGEMDGVFNGYQWNGIQWVSNSSIVSGLGSIGWNSDPTVYQKDGVWHLISGESDGVFNGYQWNGTQWVSNSSIVSGLANVGGEGYSSPTVFQKDGTWYLIAGEWDGVFNGYQWNGTQWVSNSSIVSGLGDVGTHSIPEVYQKDGIWHLISGEQDGVFNGYQWNGIQWVSNSSIVSGLIKVTTISAPAVYQKEGVWHLITGEQYGTFYGYHWDALNNTPTTITANPALSDGTYYWYINCSASGFTNQSKIREITIDATPPITNATALISNGSAYVFDTWTNFTYVNVTLSCDDGTGTGCNTTQYCTDTNNTCSPNITYTTHIQITQEETSYIRFRSNDTLGNLEDVKSETIRIDTQPPEINFVEPTTEAGNHSQDWISANVTVVDHNLDTINLTLWNSTGRIVQSN
ncbi:MAG: DUF2341 domain-containing protein, partial [Candidatus Altiarchaeota archaeon]|nr:DUF2341 domain-containing protein [Candidatus Altiarchaeota archaeon]